jgi:prepilin-type N-terminal cleavage/methylation domain-containing protein
MVPQRISMTNQRGFGLAELMVVVAVLGIITVVGTPLLLTYLQASQTRGAAQEIVTFLNQARQLAITQNVQHCVEFDVAGNRLRFHQMPGTTTCLSGTVWLGPGTDGSGWMRLQNQAAITSANANPSFTPLGAASGATITVQNSQGTSSLSVVVSPVGRIRIQ